MKCNNYSQDTHDKELVKFFNNLEIETYTHSNPPKEHDKLFVIVCDRIELQRYSDHKEWVDDKFYNTLMMLDEKELFKIDNFYKETRDQLLEIYMNKTSMKLENIINTFRKKKCLFSS